MWPAYYALTKLTSDDESRIVALIKKAGVEDRSAGGGVDQSAQEGREPAGAKVVEARPCWHYCDPRHLLVQASDLGLERGELVTVG